MTALVYAVEIAAHTGSGATTLYYATTGFCTRPADTPANQEFEGRVIDPGNFMSDMFGWVTGAARRSSGEVVLNNADGGLDAIAAYGFDGRSIILRRGRPGDAYPGAWKTVLTGTMEQADRTLKELRVLVRDRLAEVFARPYQATKFAGNNSLPGGVEGVATDLKGKPKPRLLGKARGFSPPLVNTTRLIYQISDKQINSVDAVYVGGNAVSAGTGRASLALLESNTPSAGTYDWYLGSASDGAYIRLATLPSLPLTADATEGAAASNRTAAQVAKNILLNAGVSAGDIDAASVTDLDTDNSAVLGLWTGTEEATVGEALEAVLMSVGADAAVDAEGKFFFARLESPAGTEAFTVDAYQVPAAGGEPVRRDAPRTDGRGLPCYRVILNYRRNYTPLSDEQIAGVAAAAANALKQPWLTVTDTDASVQTQFLLAPELTFSSLIDDATAAGTEATRLLTLHKARRDVLLLRLPLQELEGVTLKHGQVAKLNIDRFDWAGKKFIVCGVGYRLRGGEAELRLWG